MIYFLLCCILANAITAARAIHIRKRNAANAATCEGVVLMVKQAYSAPAIPFRIDPSQSGAAVQFNPA